jgi:hypothetical protein
MPIYNVRFITDTDIIHGTFAAANPDVCLDRAEAYFRKSIAGRGELHEISVSPPGGQSEFAWEFDRPVYELNRLTEEGRRANEAAVDALNLTREERTLSDIREQLYAAMRAAIKRNYY